MYFNKALARAYRRFAPDLFSNTVYVPGELSFDDGDVVDGDVVDAEWTTPAAEDPAPALPAPTLDYLVAQYGAETVLAANGGVVPGTTEELAEIAEKLGAIMEPETVAETEEGGSHA